MAKNDKANEISLIDVFLFVWKEKIKILAFVFVSLVIAIFLVNYKFEEKISISVKTEIKPISTLENSRYMTFNSLISKLIEFQDFKNFRIRNSEEMLRKSDIEVFRGTPSQSLIVQKINREFLFDLFIDKLNDKLYLVNVVKKSNYIDKENFSNLNEYENKVKSFLENLKLEKIKNSYIISANNISDKEKYENFINFLETSINEQIQQNLYQMFNF